MTNSPHQGTKRGALMYPTIRDILDKKRSIPTELIFFKSLNLDQDWPNIEKDLLAFAQRAD